MKRINSEEGFTLIELMVVVLIIGILIAIALPTFLGARGRAQDIGAKVSARNSLVAASVLYTDNATYTGVDALAMQAAEPSLNFVDSPTPSTYSNQVSIATTASTYSAAVESGSGTCFYIKSTSGVTTYGSSSSAACTGAQASTSATATSW